MKWLIKHYRMVEVPEWPGTVEYQFQGSYVVEGAADPREAREKLLAEYRGLQPNTEFLTFLPVL
jgi:hypothetical protein